VIDHVIDELAIALMKSRRRIASPQRHGRRHRNGLDLRLEVVKTALCDVRFGSKADIGLLRADVRFTPLRYLS
jgi:hypothetical protein